MFARDSWNLTRNGVDFCISRNVCDNFRRIRLSNEDLKLSLFRRIKCKIYGFGFWDSCAKSKTCSSLVLYVILLYTCASIVYFKHVRFAIGLRMELKMKMISKFYFSTLNFGNNKFIYFEKFLRNLFSRFSRKIEKMNTLKISWACISVRKNLLPR